MPIVLKGEFQRITTIPVYRRIMPGDIREFCWRIYNDFKELCASGKQPGTFKSYYSKHGITMKQMDGFMRRTKVRVAGLPGFVGPSGTGNGTKCRVSSPALYHSLAITCHRCGVNVFDYFCAEIPKKFHQKC